MTAWLWAPVLTPVALIILVLLLDVLDRRVTVAQRTARAGGPVGRSADADADADPAEGDRQPAEDAGTPPRAA